MSRPAAGRSHSGRAVPFWVPAFSHKARVLADWTLALLFRRETAQLAALEHPADDFRDALRAA